MIKVSTRLKREKIVIGGFTMRKKISLLLVAALCCSTILAGCSKSESTGTQGSSAQQESTVAEGTEQVASETQGKRLRLIPQSS